MFLLICNYVPSVTILHRRTRGKAGNSNQIRTHNTENHQKQQSINGAPCYSFLEKLKL